MRDLGSLVLLVVLSSTAACAGPRLDVRRDAQTLGAETRRMLERLVKVDTSHGHETDVLEPVAEQFRQAGLAVELVESAPGRGNLVARYRGTGAKRPLLLMAHVDVVPVENQSWSVAPFAVTERDGYLWGRGVSDDKGLAAAIVAVALEFAKTKPVLSRDVIFALTAGEETGGWAGAAWLVEHHKALIDAEWALNEAGGLRLADDGDTLVKVGLGVAEKTFQSYRVVAKGSGGHSSIPPTDADPVVELGRALVRLGEYRFAPRVIPATREALAFDASVEQPPVSAALAHVAATGLVDEADERILSKERGYNATLRTTCVTTQLQGSPQDNVLPTTAEATVNCRIMPDETREQTLATLRRVVGDARVSVEPTKDQGTGPAAPVEGEVPRAVKAVAAKLWPHARVVPTMNIGASDARHLRAAGITTYGISVLPNTKAEVFAGRNQHGPDERRPARWLTDGALYLRELTLELAR